MIQKTPYEPLPVETEITTKKSSFIPYRLQYDPHKKSAGWWIPIASIVVALLISAIFILFNGMNPITVYTKMFSGAFGSTFGGVGLAANVVLMITSLLILLFMRERISKLLTSARENTAKVKSLPIVYSFIVILFAYGTSRGYIHYDTSLYHAQSIRWIEEYGVVKGLACLQLRFGYNSSAFSLTALYSFKDLLGQSLHTTAGFFALLGKAVFLVWSPTDLCKLIIRQDCFWKPIATKRQAV